MPCCLCTSVHKRGVCRHWACCGSSHALATRSCAAFTRLFSQLTGRLQQQSPSAPPHCTGLFLVRACRLIKLGMVKMQVTGAQHLGHICPCGWPYAPKRQCACQKAGHAGNGTGREQCLREAQRLCGSKPTTDPVVPALLIVERGSLHCYTTVCSFQGQGLFGAVWPAVLPALPPTHPYRT